MECSAFRVLGFGFELEGLLRVFGKAAGLGFGEANLDPIRVYP